MCAIGKSCGKGMFGQRTMGFTVEREQPSNGTGTRPAAARGVQACGKRSFSAGQSKPLPGK